MIFRLKKKFSEQDIDQFISEVYAAFLSRKNEEFHFDFTEVEYVSNQELLVFSALLKVFVNSGVPFKVDFFPRGIPLSQVSLRVKKQIIQIWYVWKIFEIVPATRIVDYFGVDGNSVERLIVELGYVPLELELYTRYGVTPFIPLKFINNYREEDVKKIISPIYNLNNVIKQLLYRAKCSHPFTSKALSSIITEELYLNFLDHSLRSSFAGLDNMAAMSISFNNNLDERNFSAKEIQAIKGLNFSTEHLEESKNFFYNAQSKKFKNFPFIEFSFVDFGEGITKTLRHAYELSRQDNEVAISDNDVLRYAFRYDSSRHPLVSPENENKLIPRGLFDVWVLVKRYRGLMIVRSNGGRLIYDFSEGSSGNDGVEFLNSASYFFPGTLISIYIPAIEDVGSLNLSSIKPDINTPSNTRVSGQYKYVSFAEVYDKLNFDKSELYNSLINELRSRLPVREKPALVFFDFATTYHIEKRILRKVLYFLVSDYEVNSMNNVVIINFLHGDLLSEVSNELMELGPEVKSYKIHPLPVTSFNAASNELSIVWLGIFDKEDAEKLEQLKFEDFSLARTDFREPQNIPGHILNFDGYGNLISNFPNSEKLIEIYRRQEKFQYSTNVKRLIDKHNCIWNGGQEHIYLCNGNYYQKEYIEVTDLLNHRTDSQIVSRLLFDLIANACGSIADYHFIGITTTSQKLFKALEKQHLITEEQYVIFDSYHALDSESEMSKIESGRKYILLCDVIATGSLTQALSERLVAHGSELSFVGVLVDTISEKMLQSGGFISGFHAKVKSLYQHSITKYKKQEIAAELAAKRIIRVNPYTNIPITLSVNKTFYKDTVIFPSEISYDVADQRILIANDFLSGIKEEDINVGFLKFNSLVHPYFFDTDNILAQIREELLQKIVDKIERPDLSTSSIKIFYPRKSGVEHFDFNMLKSVLFNHDIDQIEVERFGTPEGWRFPHNSNYAGNQANGKICFILDDGSCSGDSLMQMVDEISFYNVKEILLLCFVGRVDDHKREFFSRISTVRVNGGERVNISVYFVSHWHLPTYYLDENPNIIERHWLNEVIAVPNTPLNIKRIAKNILHQIIPVDKKDFQDYKYLPKERGTGGIKIPKRKLLVVREELGKVIGFRFYKQSFKFFDLFFKKYELSPVNSEHFEEMELLCACFIYEPYLYDRMSGVLPDIAQQIEEFVKCLIFDKTISLKDLTYDWDKTDIVHLFFIVFRNRPMITKLSKEHFRRLIAFTHPKHSAINYVLFKLLYYFPINAEELNSKKHDLYLKELMLALSEEETVPKKEIKKFYTFISSLPIRGDFHSLLASLKDNYIKQDGPELHESKMSFGHNVSLFIAKLRKFIGDLEIGASIDERTWNENRETWFLIMEFITPILSFSKTFSGFLKPYPYFLKLKKIEEGKNSLREMVGGIAEVIYLPVENIKEKDSLENVILETERIQTMVQVNSDYHKLIKESKSDMTTFVDDVVSKLREIEKNVVLNNMETTALGCFNIPKQYTDILLTKELVNNIKNHATDDEKSISIDLRTENGCTLMEIRNEISSSKLDRSNGEGLKCLYLLADFAPFGFTYAHTTEETQFVQLLTFKII